MHSLIEWCLMRSVFIDMSVLLYNLIKSTITPSARIPRVCTNGQKECFRRIWHPRWGLSIVALKDAQPCCWSVKGLLKAVGRWWCKTSSVRRMHSCWWRMLSRMMVCWSAGWCTSWSRWKEAIFFHLYVSPDVQLVFGLVSVPWLHVWLVSAKCPRL